MSNNNNDVVKTPPFDESVLSYDHYNGVTLHLGDYMNFMQKKGSPQQQATVAQEDDVTNFTTELETAIEFWRAEGRKGIWIHVPKSAAQYVPSCISCGFDFQQIKRGNTSTNLTHTTEDDAQTLADHHHQVQNSSSNNTLILSQWLPDTPSKLPLGPTHQCGVGVVLLNPQDPSQMLVVQEKSGPAAAFNLWKMPTGLTDPSEDIHEAAIRELYEETGLCGTFESMLCFRQAHRPGGATSDLFFVCHMTLSRDKNKFTTSDDNDVGDVVWTPQEDEIAAIQWMSVQDFCDQDRWQGSPLYTTLNDSVLNLSKATVAVWKASSSSLSSSTTTSESIGKIPPSLPIIGHQQLEVGFGRSFGGSNALFFPSTMDTSAITTTKAVPAAVNGGTTRDSKEVTTTTLSSTAVAGMIDFLTLARGLKTTLRTGWVRQEAGPKIESVADHSWRITLMSMISSAIASSSSTTMYDTNKCIKMALVHDLAEAVVGDITPHCGVSDDDKHSQELHAITEMTKKLSSSSSSDSSSSTNGIIPMVVGEEILELWKEYEEGMTPEARLVKDMDKLEMTLQALEYETDGQNQKSLDGFFDSTRGKWRTEIGTAWGEEIESRRNKSKLL